MIFRLVRWPLGQLILLIDFLTSPKPPLRDPQTQAEIDAATRDLAIYQFKTCPFCVKTRRAIRRMGLNIELRDARNDPQWRQQLLTEGGRLQVPCLYIPGGDGGSRWLYESNDIIAYLEQRLGDRAAAHQT
ncbi:MAG: glutaredoxin [Sedimenticolaceae bacterium]